MEANEIIESKKFINLYNQIFSFTDNYNSFEVAVDDFIFDNEQIIDEIKKINFSRQPDGDIEIANSNLAVAKIIFLMSKLRNRIDTVDLNVIDLGLNPWNPFNKNADLFLRLKQKYEKNKINNYSLFFKHLNPTFKYKFGTILDIHNVLILGLGELFERDRSLLERGASERSIMHKYAEILQRLFADFIVDCEFNRTYKNGVGDFSKTLNSRNISPDIIIHDRKPGKGLIVIEIKKKGLKSDYDEQKMIGLTSENSKTTYNYGLSLILGKEFFETKYTYYTNGRQVDLLAQNLIELEKNDSDYDEYLGH